MVDSERFVFKVAEGLCLLLAFIELASHQRLEEAGQQGQNFSLHLIFSIAYIALAFFILLTISEKVREIVDLKGVAQPTHNTRVENAINLLIRSTSIIAIFVALIALFHETLRGLGLQNEEIDLLITIGGVSFVLTLLLTFIIIIWELKSPETSTDPQYPNGMYIRLKTTRSTSLLVLLAIGIVRALEILNPSSRESLSSEVLLGLTVLVWINILSSFFLLFIRKRWKAPKKMQISTQLNLHSTIAYICLIIALFNFGSLISNGVWLHGLTVLFWMFFLINFIQFFFLLQNADKIGNYIDPEALNFSLWLQLFVAILVSQLFFIDLNQVFSSLTDVFSSYPRIIEVLESWVQDQPNSDFLYDFRLTIFRVLFLIFAAISLWITEGR